MSVPSPRRKRVTTLAGAGALVAGLMGTLALSPGAADGAVFRDTNTGAVIRQSTAANWKLIFADNFSTPKLHKNWSVYNGVPGGNPAGRFAGSHLKISGGLLQLQGYRDKLYGNKFTTAGLSAQRGGLGQVYGKYEVRMRVNDGEGIAYAAMLYPLKGWPPEIDFAEDNGARGRADMLTTQHWGTKTKRGKAYRRAKVNMRTWHTVGVEWSPNRLTYTIDGRPWAQVINAYVPKVPMRLALQSQAWYCGNTWQHCPTAATPKRVDMQVDWVRIYKMAQAPR